MFLPHHDVYRAAITERTTAKSYLFVLYNKNAKNFAKISFVVRRKGNCKIAVIGLSLKWRHRASVLSSRPIKNQNEL